MKLSAFYLLSFIALSSSERLSYEGYKVYQVVPKTINEAKLVSEYENDFNFDFWSSLTALNVPVDIMVTPSAQSGFVEVLESENIDFNILIDNVEDKIQEEDQRQMLSTRVAAGGVSFTEYMRHDEILAYLDQLAVEYPDVVKTEVIGKSFEGRNLTVIKISSGGSDKPIIFIEAAIHAREWIAPPVALYIINQLLENGTNSDMYRDIDWIIHPVVNPDGYEYTHTDVRLWRKTRTPGTLCDGVDGNRNFDYQWMVTGASNWQCSETYAGHSAFSEIETQAVRDLFLANRGNIKLFIDLHSYGQLLLYPWGFTDDLPDNFDELHALGLKVNESISSSLGGSRDYAKAIGEVDLSYTIELPSGGSDGFNPDASEIIPVVTETWEGIKTFYEHIQENYVELEATTSSTYKVYQVIPKSLSEAKLLKEYENDGDFDFWSDVRELNLPVDVMVSPSSQHEFEQTLDTENLDYDILIENVQEKIEEEDMRQMISPRVTTGEVTFTEYMRHDDILAYLDRLAEDYPQIATTEVIGKSFEGRNLTVIKISSGGSNKPIIFIEAAIHAREWIAPPVALYTIQQLVENANNSDMYRDIDWIILPVVNPDGYEYSHTDERLWRKTRSPGSICDGVDGNRNFGHQWMLVGASNWQCSQTYAGYQAFSEVETQAVRDIFLANRGNIKLFLDVHSYGPYFLYSWGYTEDPPENVEELHSLAASANDAISAVRNTSFAVGNSMTLLYAVGGGSRDFSRAVGEVDLGYTVELPPGGSSGFNPDASEIIPVVTETWEGIKVFYEYIQEQYVDSESSTISSI
ncbi:hypothetical protein NQ317_008290 [Molorchus minor]|uniref:Peptidase M14 domain-containing protein n=1 Tax=Molorchus minor TaxID=1323400 RepID=A0ABQ9J111_9CUCU|nr:hypothetical protein NQ317_008290 [Molorchus minor]